MSWKGGRTEIYHNKQINELIEDILPHLQDEYDGPTDFFLTKLQEEKDEAASIQDKIEQQKKQKRIIDNRLDELRKLQEEKNRKQQLRTIKEKLREKQEKLERLEAEDLVSVEERRKQLESKLDKEEFGDLIEEKLDEHKRRLEERDDIDELRDDIKSLQSRVRELSDGESNDFDELFVEVGK